MPVDIAESEFVRKQLERLLAEPRVTTAPRQSSLLRYVVEQTLEGRGDQLKEYALHVTVLGRGSSFDPRLDLIVWVEASKLRSRLASY